jgi:hypothetical protein
MRKLTMIRKKTFVGSIMKAYLYIEAENQGELILDGINCNQVATLKNGQSVTVEIPDHELTVFIVFDKYFPQKFHASFQLDSGDSDLILYTKAHFNPFKGNPFRITEN